VERLQRKLSIPIKGILQSADARELRKPLGDELQGVSIGTGLAMVLRTRGLVMRPEKARGEPVVFVVTAGGPPTASFDRSTAADKLPVTAKWTERAGRPDDYEISHWPIGWEPPETPGRAAPSLFELLNAEIDGFTLAETLAAIEPRLKIPMYVDHAALAAHKIDPAKVPVRLPKTRTSYKRVIDRAAAHARMRSQVRVDEAGNPFLWISR
jgi:hypothetical protein